MNAFDASSSVVGETGAGTASGAEIQAPSLLGAAIRFQQMQWEAWLAWQQGWANAAAEIYDEWACRFAGGVPIDG